MTDLTLTQNQREAALVAMRTAYWECESGRSVIESILDALLAAGWRPAPQPVTAYDMLTGSPEIPVDHPVPAQPDAIAAAEARGRREGVEAAAIPKLLTNAQVNNACMSYRHDYGLCTESEARFMRSQCNEWFRAIRAALSSIPPQEADQ